MNAENAIAPSQNQNVQSLSDRRPVIALYADCPIKCRLHMSHRKI